MSPFLFVLVAKGLGWAIKFVVSRQKVKGIRFYGEDIPISQKKVVDNTMCMGVPLIQEALALHKVIDDFSSASGMV